MRTLMGYNFQRDAQGRLLETGKNLQEMQKLFLDWDIIEGDGGEGTKPGDGGAWHGVCHLVAAGAVGLQKSGDLVWFEVGWNQDKSQYRTLAVRQDDQSFHIEDITGCGASWADRVRIVAYVEGNSCGAISHKEAKDRGNSDRDDRRQDYNRYPLDFESNGGKVWEHWCTTRDIKSVKGLGCQVLRAYLTLLAVAGAELAATALRGRPYCGHPKQLKACVKAGLATERDASWLGLPEPMPVNAQILFQYSDPLTSLAACQRLPTAKGKKKYFMFQRCIHLWQRI